MSEQKFDNKQMIRYESLSDLDLVSLWSLNGNDWSSLIKEEIQAVNNQPIEAEEPRRLLFHRADRDSPPFQTRGDCR